MAKFLQFSLYMVTHGWMHNSTINKHVRCHHSGTNSMENIAIIVYDLICQYIIPSNESYFPWQWRSLFVCASISKRYFFKSFELYDVSYGTNINKVDKNNGVAYMIKKKFFERKKVGGRITLKKYLLAC